MNFFYLLVFLFLTSCATYQNKVAPARDLLASHQCEPALKILEEFTQKPDGDQLIHLLDYAAALQVCGDYKKSNQFFLKAEKLADEIDYVSVSRVAGATLLNEEMVQYKGDTFEKLFINVSLALNFMQLGQFDSALVEVRKINQKFLRYKADDKKEFELSSFAKYMSALIWEADRKYDDACIDYREAFFLDTAYRKVGVDMLRGCWKANRQDEFRSLVTKMNATNEEIKSAKDFDKTELILVFLQGWGPRKQPRADAPSFPQLVSVNSNTHFLKAEVIGTNEKVLESFQSEPIYSIEKAAMATLNADYNSLVARRVGSRIAKEVVAAQIRQQDKALGQLAWLVMVASERADLRQWSIYPKTVHTMRIPLKPGQHKIRLTGLNIYLNDSEELPDLNVNIRAGEKKFELIRSLK